MEADPEHARDLERLRSLLSSRREKGTRFFDHLAGEWDTIGVDFATGQARQRAVASLLPAEAVIADLGCGTGYVGLALLGLCSRLICVDSSRGMLEEARKRFEPPPHGMAIELREGELDALPLESGEVDGAIASMVLHHVEDQDACLSEMLRVLKPGGRAVVLELEPHAEEWMHDALGDRHLGLDSTRVVDAFERAGFEDVRLESIDDRYRPRMHAADAPAEGLPLYVVRGRAPAA